jgi:hypothetical protein
MKTLTFRAAIEEVKHRLSNGELIDSVSWQSIKVPDSVRFRETTNIYFTVDLANEPDDLDFWADDIEPNLPWADVAFHERVKGIPWNPGVAWKSWPWAKSAEQFKPEVFSHSYAERYWPKFADRMPDEEWKTSDPLMDEFHREGIRFKYGDLNDVAALMNRDPLTRQAYLPIFFPEDTGVVHGERVPCTLGYHFMHRNGEMDITYYIRSCDFVRHFRDDLYMTLRLLLWMISKVDFDCKPGRFIFHCSSLHCFEHDRL